MDDTGAPTTNHGLSAKVLEGIDPVVDPHRAFASLWHAAEDHVLWQTDLGFAARQFIKPVYEALRDERALPAVPVAAALAALDRYLGKRDSGESSRTVPVEGGPRYHVMRRPEGWHSRYAFDRCNFREFWAHHHHCVPAQHHGIAVRIQAYSARRGGELELPFVALAGGFEDGVEPVWREPHPPYRATVLAAPSKRWETVRQCLERAREEHARVLVLPELTIDAEVLDQVRRWLDRERLPHLALVAAGSFHVARADGCFNVAWLLDGSGRDLMEQRKLVPFRHDEALDEDILAGRELWLLATELGLVAIGICLDFCELSGTPIGNLWPAVGPALVLVPSMGESTTNAKHIKRARDLYDQHETRVVVASQPSTAKARACGIACGGWPTALDGFPVLGLTIR